LGERESGTARLEEGVAAWNACLAVTTSVWPPDWVRIVETRRDETQAEIGRRRETVLPSTARGVLRRPSAWTPAEKSSKAEKWAR
jgi:hypothetical protein